jgi:AIR synthase-related protein
MSNGQETLQQIVGALESSSAVRDKIEIRDAYAPALDTLAGDDHAETILVGDDCAAIPDQNGGYLLFAGEALLEDFVAQDPWFAGYSAVMVNISDICAMGGRPTALVDMLWTPDMEAATDVWSGMKSAAQSYGVPIVGGHTTLTRQRHPVRLAVSILGRASCLMTSFNLKPGLEIMMVVDLNGAYRGDQPFWNASVGTKPERLRALVELLPELAEKGWSETCRDISNGGIVGTLIMLLECSGVGARLHLDAIPKPKDVPLSKWLLSFPSFGFLIAVKPEHVESVRSHFLAQQVACEIIGEAIDETALELALGDKNCVFWTNPAESH